MPVETPLYFAQVIQDHLELKRRNAELERAMPLDRYKDGDPFNNHPAFKTEEQARLEETMENPAVDAHIDLTAPSAVAVADEDDADSFVHEGDDFWTRSRDFDWGD
jgi:hypothetical protein